MTTQDERHPIGGRGQVDGDADGEGMVDPATLDPLATEEEWPAVLAELATACAPRRFALCETIGDRVDGAIFGWGQAFPDRAVVHWPDGMPAGRFRSAERALDLFRRCCDLRLVWLDPDPAAGPTVS